jgi:hypothetical protein
MNLEKKRTLDILYWFAVGNRRSRSYIVIHMYHIKCSTYYNNIYRHTNDITVPNKTVIFCFYYLFSGNVTKSYRADAENFNHLLEGNRLPV